MLLEANEFAIRMKQHKYGKTEATWIMFRPTKATPKGSRKRLAAQLADPDSPVCIAAVVEPTPDVIEKLLGPDARDEFIKTKAGISDRKKKNRRRARRGWETRRYNEDHVSI